MPSGDPPNPEARTPETAPFFARFDRYPPIADPLGRVISRRFTIWQKAVALAPVLLLLVYLPGEMMLRCSMDGLLRPTCCCPQKAEAETAGPVVKAADCCDPVVAQDTRPAAEAARAATRDLVPVATTAIVAPSLPSLASPSEQLDRAWQRHRPCARGTADRPAQARVPDLRRTTSVDER